MAYNPNNPNGQAESSGSSPVVIASNQFPLASLVADATANFSATTVETAGMVYNNTTWDRMRGVDAVSGTTDNITTPGVLAAGIGPGYALRNNPSNLGTATNSTSVFNTDGSSSVMVTVGTTTSGTFTVEGTGDGTNWGIPEVFDGTNDVWVTGANITPILGNNYQILSSNFRSIRLRTTATLGATMAHAFNGSMAQPFLGGLDTGFAPHNFGYTLWHKEIASATTLTSLTVLTPPTGKRYTVTDLTVMAGGTTAGIVTIYDATTGTAFTNQITPTIFRGEFAPSTTSRPGFSKTFSVPYYSAAVNNSLLITTSAAMTIYVQLNGYYV